MSSAVTTKIAKPQMRNLLVSRFKFAFAIGMGLSISCGLAYKFLVGDPRKRKYAEFYKTYDAEKALQSMIAAGVLDSGKLDD